MRIPATNSGWGLRIAISAPQGVSTGTSCGMSSNDSDRGGI